MIDYHIYSGDFDAVGSEFEPTTTVKLRQITLQLKRIGSPVFDLAVRVYAAIDIATFNLGSMDDLGTLLGQSDTVPVSGVGTAAQEDVDFVFSTPFNIRSTEKYLAVLTMINHTSSGVSDRAVVYMQAAAVNASLGGIVSSYGDATYDYSLANDELLMVITGDDAIPEYPAEMDVRLDVEYGNGLYVGTGVSIYQPASAIAAAVWNSLISGYTTSGTFGALVQKLLTVAKFLGLK